MKQQALIYERIDNLIKEQKPLQAGVFLLLNF